jgi:hypothetical protein
MKPLIGIAIVLALTPAVMPTLEPAPGAASYPARYSDVIAVAGGTPATTPPGQGGSPRTPAIQAVIAVPNFIAYRHNVLSESDTTAPEDVEPTGILDDAPHPQ